MLWPVFPESYLIFSSMNIANVANEKLIWRRCPESDFRYSPTFLSLEILLLYFVRINEIKRIVKSATKPRTTANPAT